MRALAGRIYRDAAGGLAAGMAFLGTELGLFKAMAGRGPLRAAEVVALTGLQPRYVEEWLNGMVSVSYLDYDPLEATYSLPDEHAYLLSSEGTDHFMGGIFGMMPALVANAPRLKDAFRDGGGIPYGDFPPACRHAIDLMNRGSYAHRFVDYWLAQLPDVGDTLERGGSALDVGCGQGQVAIALAKAFPRSEIIGVDPDMASVEQARSAAREAGVAERVQFYPTTLAELDPKQHFDLVTLCDVLHDLPNPSAVLTDIRTRLRCDGTLFVIEPKVADKIEDNINDIAAMFYGFSLFHCLTQSLAQGGVGLGACVGPQKTLALFTAAGFTHSEKVEIKSPVNLFYAARP